MLCEFPLRMLWELRDETTVLWEVSSCWYLAGFVLYQLSVWICSFLKYLFLLSYSCYKYSKIGMYYVLVKQNSYFFFGWSTCFSKISIKICLWRIKWDKLITCEISPFPLIFNLILNISLAAYNIFLLIPKCQNPALCHVNALIRERVPEM